MKKFIALIATSVLSVSAFADFTATSVATWDASATKDTKSALVVTPMKSLSFQYAEGLNQFNTVDGAFDVTIEGQTGASDFNLKSQVLRNTLSRSADASTLAVGVAWNGTKLTNQPMVMVDVGQGLTNDLVAVANGFKTAGRSSAQSKFTFSIDSATSDGTAATEFNELVDGNWDGEVAVQFTATWAE